MKRWEPTDSNILRRLDCDLENDAYLLTCGDIYLAIEASVERTSMQKLSMIWWQEVGSKVSQ